jgi:hypothetical protein
VQIARCHAEPEAVRALDKFGADRVLALLLGEKASRALGPAPTEPVASIAPAPPPPSKPEA